MIYSAVRKKDENGQDIDVEIKFNEGDLRQVLELGDSDNDPIIIPERLCKGLWCRMGFTGYLNGKYLKTMFITPYKFLIHCVVHVLSRRKGAYDETSDYIMNIITCFVLNMPYNVSQVIFNYMVDNVGSGSGKYIMYPRFIQMMIDDQFKDLPKDPDDILDLRNMTADTISRLSKNPKKDDPEPRVRRMICKIDNPAYIAPENDAWRHDNNNSENEDDKMREMVEKKLRYWFVRDGKRKRTPKTSPAVSIPKFVHPKIVIKGPSREPQSSLIDELVVNLADISKEGVDLTKVTLEQYLKHTEATIAKDQSASVQAEGVKEKQPEEVVHEESGDADDESTETQPEIDMATVGYGKVQMKKKPQKKKKKGSDDEDTTYTPTAVEKKKLRIKCKAIQTGVIPRNFRARKGGASMPEGQSGKVEKHVATSKGIEAEKVQSVEVPKAPEVQSVEKPEVEKKGADDNVVITEVRISSPPPPPPESQPIPESGESSQPKKIVLPDMFEGFPNVRGEYKDDILSGDEFDMFHDASIKDLEKKVSILEKEKAKEEAERDELKKQLEELTKVNEEIKSVMIKQTKKIKKMEGDIDDNAKLFELLSTEISDRHVKNVKLNDINKTLNQLITELHEASANEFKAIKLEMEALRADKAVKVEQLNILYIVMESHLGINVQAIYNNLEIQRVEERRVARERELAQEATQRRKGLVIDVEETLGSSSQPEAGGSSRQTDVEMVDVEADQAQGFVLGGRGSR
ncbi:hypothetical protein HanPI659440_Chr08g0310631 [Helianthus annuus]|nr:hypothetical protein HanPI659440_Chr08g0310631 [Helianthus annuus]